MSAQPEAIPDLAGNHEEADTGLILHAKDAVERSQYKRILVIQSINSYASFWTETLGRLDGKRNFT